MKQSYIGTEHILLGLVREGQGVAAQILVKRAGSLDRVRAAVAAEQGRPPNERSGPAEGHERTPGAGQVLAAAEDLAGGGAVGTQHLLEALARSDDTAAAKALAAVGVDADALAAALDEVGVEGTADVVPEEAAAGRWRSASRATPCTSCSGTPTASPSPGASSMPSAGRCGGATRSGPAPSCPGTRSSATCSTCRPG